MIPVLSVASECVPLIKTGGLADVAGALPGALAGCGIEMRTLLPGYRPVLAATSGAPSVCEMSLFGGTAHIREGRMGESVLYVLDAPQLFDRPGGPYLDPQGRDWQDNPLRFAALCQAAARIGIDGVQGWKPRILHLHDWQAGLVPQYLDAMGAGAGLRTVMTIHNIAFQGMAPAGMRAQLGLPEAGFTQDGYEYWGQISALKAGLMGADRITTVSPTYASELLTPEFGMGLDGVLQHRRADLSGILNGIDLSVWGAPYKSPRGKARFRKMLRDRLGLPETDGPLCVVVSRMAAQKGLDVLLDVAPQLLDQGGQLAVLGSGDPALEQGYKALAAHPNAAVEITYDEALSHLMIAGGDAILVPSRFEPCGLTQLYGLSHATLPLVARTGGLADTVIDANPAGLSMGVANGFQFAPVTHVALSAALDRLMACWQSPEVWARMQRNAMRQPVGWEVSAEAYAALFRDLAEAS